MLLITRICWSKLQMFLSNFVQRSGHGNPGWLNTISQSVLPGDASAADRSYSESLLMCKLFPKCEEEEAQRRLTVWSHPSLKVLNSIKVESVVYQAGRISAAVFRTNTADRSMELSSFQLGWVGRALESLSYLGFSWNSQTASNKRPDKSESNYHKYTNWAQPMYDWSW